MSMQWRRASHGAVFGGVCAGLAQLTGINTTLMRVLWVLAAIFLWTGPVAVLYIILWAVLPMEDGSSRSVSFSSVFAPGGKGMLWLGVALVCFGAFMLLKALLPASLNVYMVSLGLIIAGILVVWAALRVRKG